VPPGGFEHPANSLGRHTASNYNPLGYHAKLYESQGVFFYPLSWLKVAESRSKLVGLDGVVGIVWA
jgi:hypothetical protein